MKTYDNYVDVDYQSIAAQPVIVAADLLNFEFSISSQFLSAVNVTVTLDITPKEPLPTGSVLSVQFPSDYKNLSLINPSPECNIVPSNLICTFESGQIKITGFTGTESKIEIVASGITNPTSVTGTPSFTITAVSSDGFSLINDTSPANITFSAPVGIPVFTIGVSLEFTTSEVQSDITFTLHPNVQLYEGSVIEITMPSQFNFAGSPSCTASGDMFTYASCTPLTNKVTIVLDIGIPDSATFSIVISPVTLPTVTATTTYNEISVYSMHDSIV